MRLRLSRVQQDPGVVDSADAQKRVLGSAVRTASKEKPSQSEPSVLLEPLTKALDRFGADPGHALRKVMNIDGLHGRRPSVGCENRRRSVWPQRFGTVNIVSQVVAWGPPGDPQGGAGFAGRSAGEARTSLAVGRRMLREPVDTRGHATDGAAGLIGTSGSAAYKSASKSRAPWTTRATSMPSGTGR